jgi:transcriptional regulator with XRE-family HTH domain
MTPFGAKIRQLRQQRGISQKQMAADLHVSAAYLSALEHGHRGRPAPGFIMQIAGYLGCIWDEAEDLKHLADLSHPRRVIDTGGLSPPRTRLANLLAQHIMTLPDRAVDQLLQILEEFESNAATSGAKPPDDVIG